MTITATVRTGEGVANDDDVYAVICQLGNDGASDYQMIRALVRKIGGYAAICCGDDKPAWLRVAARLSDAAEEIYNVDHGCTNASEVAYIRAAQHYAQLRDKY